MDGYPDSVLYPRTTCPIPLQSDFYVPFIGVSGSCARSGKVTRTCILQPSIYVNLDMATSANQQQSVQPGGSGNVSTHLLQKNQAISNHISQVSLVKNL